MKISIQKAATEQKQQKKIAPDYAIKLIPLENKKMDKWKNYKNWYNNFYFIIILSV